MSQPKTTSQKPKPPSAAEKNLSLWRYLPRSTPSMSDTATLTRLPGALRTASSTLLAGRSCGMDGVPPESSQRHSTARACAAKMAQCAGMSDPPPRSDAPHALLALHAAVLLFGFAGLFGKWLALPAVTIVFGRSAIAAVALSL